MTVHYNTVLFRSQFRANDVFFSQSYNFTLSAVLLYESESECLAAYCMSHL
jgi:hypothetical protein